MLEKINNIRKNVNIPFKCYERYLTPDSIIAPELVDKGIRWGGISNLVSGYAIVNPTPRDYMIICTFGGKGRFRALEYNWELVPGSLLIAPPGFSHSWEVFGKSWDILWFYLLVQPQWNFLAEKGCTLTNTSYLSKMRCAMEGYLAEKNLSDNKSGHDEKNTQQKLYAVIISNLLTYMIYGNKKKEIHKNSNLIGIMEEIKLHPEKPYSIAQIAHLVNMSISSLQRYLKKMYGKTAWQIILESKMQSAMDLLKNTDYPLKVIAERIGYADEFIFSTAFKNYYKKSPSAYRKL